MSFFGGRVDRGRYGVDSTPGSGDPRRWCRDAERGAAAVEFALVLSLLVALLGGIVDFGFAFNAQISLTHAAREGVRVEAIGTGDPVQAATAAFSAVAVDNFVAQVVNGCGSNGNPAVLRTRADYNAFFLPFLSRSLESQAVMRCGG